VSKQPGRPSGPYPGARWCEPGAEDDVDFLDQARRAAEEIPNAEFLLIGGTDHLGVDTSEIDPEMPAVLRTLRETS